jgi:SAM-dependent methyltransferase
LNFEYNTYIIHRSTNNSTYTQMTDSHNVIYDLFNSLPKVIVPKNTNLELELRFIIDSRKPYDVNTKTYSTDLTIDLAKKLIDKYKTNTCTVEQSINFIADSKVKQMIFIRGEQQKSAHTYYKKTKIIEPVYFLHNTLPAYRLNVNYETPIDEFTIKDAKIARIRLRYTITIENWRLDLTLVKNVESFSNPAILKQAKNTMLFDIDTYNFVDKAPWKLADSIEFELEYIGKFTDITISSLSIGNDLFNGIINVDTEENNDNNNKNNDNDNKNNDNDNKSNSLYQSIIYKVAKYIKPKQAEMFKRDEGIKRLSNQPIELDKNTYLKELANNMTGYYITDKVDGKRAIIYISPDGSYALTDTITTLDITTTDTYIFDSEFYEDVYYIFDIMVWQDVVITDKTFEERLKLFDEVSKINKLFQLKPFVKLTEDFTTEIKNFKARSKPYEVDGCVLTPALGYYDSMQVYKYKDIKHLTVDFLIKKCPDKLLGIKPYTAGTNETLYLLFCGISKNVYIKLAMRMIKWYDTIFSGIDYKELPRYFPIQFQPSNMTYAYLFRSKLDNLNGEVGEFKYVDEKWVMNKVREDRRVDVARGNFFGNNYKIAELIWMSYKNPLVIEDINKSEEGYFQKRGNSLQEGSRNCNRFIISEIFDHFRNTEHVIDMASGNGQDLFRYAKYGIRNLICLEIDKNAISELIYRKHDFSNIRERGSMSIQVHQLDINDEYKDNIVRLAEINIPATGVNLIVCNFAFHYFLATRKSLINVVKFINHYLKPGGRFVFTAFDGREVIKLLNENNGNYMAKVGDQMQYGIKKQYTTNFLDLIGQKIDVLLPFSKDTYYPEYLVNIDYISGEFAKLGYVLEIDKGFGEYLDDYKRVNRKKYDIMSNADKQWVSLYHYYCLYKKS